MLQKSLAALAVCLGLVACATPEGVPPGANAEFNPTTFSGVAYSWRRATEHGCADFGGSDNALSVRLMVDRTKCEGRVHTEPSCEESCGPSFVYYGGNYGFFQNYWSWTSTDLRNSVVLDSNGRGLGFRPCPHSLSAEQLATLRLVARETLAIAATDAERQTLERVGQLLAATNGADLMSGQFGCSTQANPP